VEGGKYCRIHGGAQEQIAQRVADQNLYRLAKFQQKYQDKLGASNVKSLRDEIAILRMMLEEKLNLCNNETDLALASNSLADLVQKIEKTVVSCHKLELSADLLLDKAKLAQIADQVVQAIGQVCEPSVAALLSEKVAQAFLGGLEAQPPPIKPSVPLSPGLLDDDED
jgi:hypothetical protein